ncbi:MAG TPA: hypothetical protein P5513_04940 [Candidatus Diapherotrites archaeon]|nr:hypothetical protein [Candidatus Diapherotrites archaeon]
MREFVIPESRWYTIDYQYALYKMGELINNYSHVLGKFKNQQANIRYNYSKDIL